MASINKAILIGNLGADPEVRTTQSGTQVANFNIATTDQWTDQGGQRQERTEWHRIVAWGRLGEICAQYLRKGKQVYIEGRIQTRKWEDKNGQTRYTTEIVAQTMQMLGRAGDAPASGMAADDGGALEEPAGQVMAARSGGGAGGAGGAGGGFDQTDDDLPF